MGGLIFLKGLPLRLSSQPTCELIPARNLSSAQYAHKNSSQSKRNYEANFHTEEKRYSCNERGKCYKGRGALHVHMETHKPPEERRTFDCELCGKILMTKIGLEHHMAGHMDKEEWRHSCAI